MQAKVTLMIPRAILPVLLLLAACSTLGEDLTSTKGAASDAAMAVSRDARITLRRGGCGYIAACPGYEFSLSPDGSYRYEGFRNVEVLGVREGRLAADAWARAEKVLAEAGWNTLADIDRREGGIPCMSDSPFAAIVRRASASEERTFNYNLGCMSPKGDALINALAEVLALPAPDAGPP